MKKLPVLAVILSLVSASVVTAQTSTDSGERRHRGGFGRGHGPGPGLLVLRALDADKNRELSAAEIANAPAALRAFDANNDGSVTLAELRPTRSERPEGTAPTPPEKRVRPDRPAEGERTGKREHPVSPVLLALDADGDRVLSVSEISQAATSLTALDADKNGALTADELRPLE